MWNPFQFRSIVHILQYYYIPSVMFSAQIIKIYGSKTLMNIHSNFFLLFLEHQISCVAVQEQCLLSVSMRKIALITMAVETKADKIETFEKIAE